MNVKKYSYIMTRKGNDIMNKKYQYILFLPCIVLISYFMIIPLLGTILPTFTDASNGMFSVYTDFFKDEYMMSILCIALTVFPILTNSVVRSFAWMSILGKNGVINTLLMKLNLITEPLSLLYTEGAIIVGTVYIFLPLMIISLVGVMENVENDLLEAAESLGANKIVAFFKVIFPLSLPGLIVGTVLVFTGALTAYTTPQLLGGNKNTVLATLIYQKTMTLGDWQGAAVVATIMIVVTLIVVKTINFLASRLDKRGVS